jgi:hypothetical protein
MKKHLILILVMLFSLGLLFAQDEEAPKKRKERPVKDMFASDLAIDQQTSVIPDKKTLEMQIQHRFGLIKDNGISDLFGIYAPSANTRMGLNYSILDNLMVGYGITRKNMYNDFQIKWAFLRQTRSGKIPLTLAVYANAAIDGRNKSVFGDDYTFVNRLSYFSQLIIGRKFTDWFSLELNASFTHYNAVKSDEPNVKGYDHDVFGWGGHMRFKFTPQSSFVISYSTPVKIGSLSENTETLNAYKSNFGIAYEVATATHAFQIFATTANGIIPQDIYMYNTSDWTKGEFRIGFNITRMWGF